MCPRAETSWWVVAEAVQPGRVCPSVSGALDNRIDFPVDDAELSLLHQGTFG
jgi:hypothetical protein